jgi:hypothetical protein
MFKNNNLPLGILYGCIAPAVAWLVFAYFLNNDALIMNKPAAPYLIALFLNFLLLRYMAKKYLDKTANGIMIATFVCMLLVFFFKIRFSG